MNTKQNLCLCIALGAFLGSISHNAHGNLFGRTQPKQNTLMRFVKNHTYATAGVACLGAFGLLYTMYKLWPARGPRPDFTIEIHRGQSQGQNQGPLTTTTTAPSNEQRLVLEQEQTQESSRVNSFPRHMTNANDWQGHLNQPEEITIKKPYESLHTAYENYKISKGTLRKPAENKLFFAIKDFNKGVSKTRLPDKNFMNHLSGLSYVFGRVFIQNSCPVLKQNNIDLFDKIATTTIGARLKNQNKRKQPIVLTNFYHISPENL